MTKITNTVAILLIVAAAGVISGTAYALESTVYTTTSDDLKPSPISGLNQGEYNRLTEMTIERLSLTGQLESLSKDPQASDNEKQNIEKRISELKSLSKEITDKRAKTVKFSEEVNQKIKTAQKIVANSDLPFVMAGKDHKTAGIWVQIYEDDGRDYKSEIEKMIDYSVPVTVTYGKNGWDTDSCDNQTSDCNPLIGGIEIHVKYTSTTARDCTISLPAVRNILFGTESGFITAGHCAPSNFSTYKDVWQPTFTDPKVGETTKRVIGGTCDCAFVKKTSADTLANKVWSGFASTVTITSKADPAENDLVLMIGQKSGIKLGEVVNDSVSGTVEGTPVSDAMQIDGFATVDGDSGGTFIDYDTFAVFHGLVTGHSGTNTTIMIPWSNIDAGLDLQ